MSKSKHRPHHRSWDRYTKFEIWKAKRLWQARTRRLMYREQYELLESTWRAYGWP